MGSLTSFVASVERVIPLEVTRAYRDASARPIAIEYVRLGACTHCWEVGCWRCGTLGWSVARESLLVEVPAGAVPGQRIKLEGVGDVVDGRARALQIEVAEPGPRADELRAVEADFASKLERAWLMEYRTITRRRTRWIVGLIGAPLALLLLLILYAIGSAVMCPEDKACRSPLPSAPREIG